MDKVKISLVVCICIIGILAIANVWSYQTHQDYQTKHSYTNVAFNGLNSIYQDYKSSHSHTNVEYDALNSIYQDYQTSHSHTNTEHSELQNQITHYESILNIQLQEVVLDQHTINQDSNTHSLVKGVSCHYAGYLEISLTSTTDNAYVIVEYWYDGSLYSGRKTIGTSDTTRFLVLPAHVSVYVGNTNWWTEATHTVDITYHY